MTSWLIDAQGEAWPVASGRLQAALFASQPADVFRTYAVASLGFAEVTLKPNAAKICWRPTATTAETYAGLLMLLAELNEQRVVITTMTPEPQHQVCPTIAAAIAHVTRVFQTSHCIDEGHFIARRRRPESLRNRNCVSQLLAAAMERDLTFSAVDLWTILDRYSAKRFVLLEPQGASGPLKVLAWGKGYAWFDTQWADGVSGSDFEDQPDRSYARWAAEAYRQAHRSNEVIVEDVSASTWWPGRGRMSINYTRAVVPIHIKGRGPCVLSTAQVLDVA